MHYLMRLISSNWIETLSPIKIKVYVAEGGLTGESL